MVAIKMLSREASRSGLCVFNFPPKSADPQFWHQKGHTRHPGGPRRSTSAAILGYSFGKLTGTGSGGQPTAPAGSPPRCHRSVLSCFIL